MKIVILIAIFILTIATPILAVPSSNHITYDANGNRLTGFGLYFEYNGFNQLSRVRNGTANGTIIEEYVYDGDGNRVIKREPLKNQTTYYVDKNFVRVVNLSGTFDTVYVYDEKDLVARRDPDGKKFFYHPDHLGSTTLVTNETGHLVDETTYEPYGLILAGGSDRYDYTGKEQDSGTGLEYYGARYYDPRYAQFTQPDSTLPDIYDPQQLNRYSYARNNPYRYTDRSGNIPTSTDTGIVSQVNDYIVSVENANPSMTSKQILEIVESNYGKYESSSISNHGGSSYSPMYVYTEQRGIIDNRHFFYNARYGQNDVGKGALSFIEYPFELVQSITHPHSSFTYEDLTSNQAGRDFGGTVNNNEPLSKQYASFMNKLEPKSALASLVASMPTQEIGYKPSASERKYTGYGKGVPQPAQKQGIIENALESIVSFFVGKR